MRFRPSMTAAVALLALGCFETPVRETLEIRVLPSRRAAVTVSVEIAESLRNEGAERRAERVRGDLLREQDAWSRRFADLDAESETFRRVHSGGQLVRIERSATIALEDLSQLFSETAVSVLTTTDGSVDEVILQPFASPRATRDQELEAHRALGRFASALEAYYASTDELYRHLRANPHRATPAFAALFEVDSGARNQLSTLERALVERIDAAMSVALEALTTGSADEIGPDELATLVYDPFPAEIRFVVAGTTQHDGFTPAGPDAWKIERKSLSGALASLAGTWAQPDPLVILLTSSEEGNRDLELADVVATERRSSAPAATAIRAALEQKLRPAPVYRLRWKTVP